MLYFKVAITRESTVDEVQQARFGHAFIGGLENSVMPICVL